MEPNLSGKLGHLQSTLLKLNYIGVLSRLVYKNTAIKYDVLVLLSGPEPQRTLLENKLFNELQNYPGTILFVRGVFSNETNLNSRPNLKIVQNLLSEDLEVAINQSNLIIARSGYSTVMDLAVLRKKAFFIPTPGQFEQEYLARRMQENNIAPFSTQQDFCIEKLNEITKYDGFTGDFNTKLDLNLFQLFNSK
jgi:predicted glycosyltransferase